MIEPAIVSVVIGTYNRLDFLKTAIETVRKDISSIAAEIIVVDGGSTDGTIKWLVEQKDIISIIQHNRGEWRDKPITRRSWGYFMNLGFKAASGKYICMLSDDCLVVPGAIKNGVRLFESQLSAGKKVGAMAFYWRNWPEQKKYWVGLTYGSRMFVNHGLYLREVLQKIDFADGNNYSFYHADGDMCLRLWQVGYICIDSPNSYIEHYSDANTAVRSSNMERQKEDWRTYTNKWEHLGNPDSDWIEKKYIDTRDTAKNYWSKINNNEVNSK